LLEVFLICSMGTDLIRLAEVGSNDPAFFLE
jgi:hypothetical protein